ncbi:hypothetical protein SDC9_183479 [bioreactor metagenome]|uniref:Uncharacterized protein n=1 Tax=bioreactor metagenome TaxID=1076179 RepID=A0A645HIM4_9ZZZZ
MITLDETVDRGYGVGYSIGKHKTAYHRMMVLWRRRSLRDRRGKPCESAYGEAFR